MILILKTFVAANTSVEILYSQPLDTPVNLKITTRFIKNLSESHS